MLPENTSTYAASKAAIDAMTIGLAKEVALEGIRVNAVRPGIINTDFGMSKRTRITESLAFEIRGEFFNIFNHTQFNNPSGNISSSRFGLVSSARDPRIGQVSAKFYW